MMPLRVMDTTRSDVVSTSQATIGPQPSGAGQQAREVGFAQGTQSIDEVVSGLNEMVQNLHRNLQFTVDEESGDTVIKVVDSETDEVVRQIPSEDIVRLHRQMKEVAGVLFRSAV
jgi:flagellar protein FlaG